MTDDKQLRKAVENATKSYLVGIRNEIADLKTTVVNLVRTMQRARPTVQDVHVKNHPPRPDVQDVKVVNDDRTDDVVEAIEHAANKSVEGDGAIRESVDKQTKTARKQSESINKTISKVAVKMATSLGKAMVKFENMIFKVQVMNPTRVKFPDTQKVEVTNQQKQATEMFIANRNPADAIPVILTRKDRKKFYNAVDQIITGFTSMAGIKKAIENIDITIDADEINIGMDDVEALLGDDVWEKFDEDAAVVSATETTIASFTVPVGKKARLWAIHATGDSCAAFTLKVGAIIKAKGRTAWTERNWQPVFKTIEAAAGSTIAISVEHDESGTRSFNASLSGILLDA